LITTLYFPNARDRAAGTSLTALTNSASTMHPGGLHGLIGDGSVRYITDLIQTWPFDPITGNPAGWLFGQVIVAIWSDPALVWRLTGG
jgi:hypothetical protein